MPEIPFSSELETEGDHGVPAELIELHESMEWDEKVAKIGSAPNGPAAQ